MAKDSRNGSTNEAARADEAMTLETIIIRRRARGLINAIVEEELEAALGAAPSVRVGVSRVGYRHGARPDADHGFEFFGRLGQRLLDRRRVALIGALHGHADDRARLHVDGVLGLVGQVRAPVLHLRDARARVVRVLPITIAPFLGPLPIELGEVRARRRLDARRLRQPGEEVVIGLAGIPPHDAPQRRIRLERRGVDADRVPLHQVRRRLSRTEAVRETGYASCGAIRTRR